MEQLETSTVFDISTYLDSPDVLSAGKLCLEFANTANWHASGNPDESLHSYNDVVMWAMSSGVLNEEAGRALIEQASLQPRLAAQVYTWAIELREAIYRIFAALAGHALPASQDIDLLNEALPHAFALPHLAYKQGNLPSENGDNEHKYDVFGLRWRGDDRGLDSILWPVLRSAARLLTTGEHDRIGQCADDRGCGYLFYDTSRNRSRRWCDMGSCGNRAKSQRHYARYRGAAAV